MRLLLWLALLLPLVPLHAQELDPVEFFGAAFFVPEPDNPRAGTLKLALDGDLPAFVDLHSSGDGDCSDRFVPAAAGLEIRADEKLHRTCEAAIDLGADRLVVSFLAVSLDRGATLAVHLRALDPEKGRDYLCELRRNRDGSFQLQLRVGDGARFNPVPGAQAQVAEIEFPCELTVTLQGGQISLAAAGQNLTGAARTDGGVRPGVAVSDGHARVRQLRLDAAFAASWAEDAARRLAARRALLRLRDLAVGGLLQGVWAHEYPATAVQREQFAAALARLNPAPLTLEAAPRAGALAAIADELADNPQAQHMAGVAALLAGNVIAGREYLTRAEKIAPAPITRLALAEAYRRAGNPTAAETALAQAAASLPGALKPEHALLTARLSAARGDLGGAAATLEAALKTWPEHAALRAYCESARSLTRPAALAPAPRAGPLGLRVLSDLTDKQLAVLTARLEPYLEKFRVWLPNLARQLAGTLVIYNGPEDYLNAALLVAGDQLDNVAGMYLPAGIEGKPTVLACRGFGEDELLRTLVHELWHLAFATTPGGKDAPRWLNEGMAVYLSAGRVDRGAMNYDRLPEEFADGLDLCPESLRRALAAKGADFYVPAAIRANYAAGWAVVWHLASGDNVSLLRRLLAGDSEPLAGLAAGLDRLAPELGRRVAGLKKGS